MPEIRDFYPEGEKHPGVEGKEWKDFIPDPNWNAAEARPYTADELALLAIPGNPDYGPPTALPPRSFTCSACGAQFPSLKDIRDHRRQIHPR